MSTSLHYQSPIVLHHCCSCNIDISKPISIKGVNFGAIYDASNHIFAVKDKIIIKFNSKSYQLEEYHFHVPGEHDINGKIYDAEVHYVFVQLKRGEKHIPIDYVCKNICNCGEHSTDVLYDRNIFVIGRAISSNCKCVDLAEIQPEVPSCYYMYDGSLTTGNFAPVRWIVGDEPIHLNLDEIKKYAKDARPLQELDGRIVLFTENC